MKKKYLIMLLALTLSVEGAFTVQAEDTKDSQNIISEKQNIENDRSSIAVEKDFYEETSRVTRAEKKQEGLKIIGDKTYFFNSDGSKFRGVKTIDGKKYYFRWNSYDLYKDGWLYFWRDNKWVFANQDTGAFLTGEKNLSAGKDQNGKKFPAGVYSFNSDGVKTGYKNPELEEGWSKDGQYYVENGKKVRGIKEIDGKRYYFGWNDNKLYKNGWLYFWTDENSVYTDKKTGAFVVGEKELPEEKDQKGNTYKSGVYIFDSKGFKTGYKNPELEEGWSKDGQYYVENGKKVRGIKEIDGKRYYFGWNDNKLYKNGWLYFWTDKNSVYTDKNTGAFVVGEKELPEEKDQNGNAYNAGIYTFDSKGFKTGYRNPNLKEGWSKDGQYYVENGKKVRGLKTINGKRYYFDWNNYKLYKKGWLYFSGYNQMWAYADPKNNGAFLIGRHSIDGKKYNFSREGFVQKIRLGIDVSQFNGNIDWRKAKNQIDFAIVRASGRYTSSGRIYNDTMFRRNMSEVNRLGIPAGAYFFSQAINEREAREEADHICRQLRGYVVSLPVIIDVETVAWNGRQNHLGKQQLTNVIKAFCERVKAHGYEPMLYTNTSEAQWNPRFYSSQFVLCK